MPELVLLAGIPGTGKSTFAKTFFDLKYAVVSSDKIREQLAGSLRSAHDQRLKPWDLFYRDIEEYLRHSVDVIADATFLTVKHRQRARDIAEKIDARLHLILFKNLDAADRRNRHRAYDAQVPQDVMTDMTNLYWDTLSVLDVGLEKYDTVTQIEAFN